MSDDPDTLVVGFSCAQLVSEEREHAGGVRAASIDEVEEFIFVPEVCVQRDYAETRHVSGCVGTVMS